MTRRTLGLVVLLTTMLAGCDRDAYLESSPSPTVTGPASPTVTGSASPTAPPGSTAPSSPGPDSAAPTGPAPSSGPTRPSRPPRDPTDNGTKTAWVVGTVTSGGSGPCYGLVTDDGTQYALHDADGPTLTKGTRIRVRTGPARARIFCGPGKLVEMTAAEPLR